MIAVTPAFAASSIPSRKGKKASEAMTAPLAFSPALWAAIMEESTRDICPAPMPTTRLALGQDDGVGPDVLAHLAGEEHALDLLLGRCALGDHLEVLRVTGA